MDIQQDGGQFDRQRDFAASPSRHWSFEPGLQSVMAVCLRRSLRVASPAAFSAVRNAIRLPAMAVRSYSIPPDSQDGPVDDLFIPTRIDRSYETPDVTRARLVYQSRKRGILETDLVLSTFADKYLPTMSPEELKEYDKVIGLLILR